MRNRAPKRFAADSWQSTDFATRSQLEKLKKQWREEWEAERVAVAHRESEEAVQSLNAKLDKMVERRRNAMSPRVRGLWDAARRAQNEEDEAARTLALPPPEAGDTEER